MSHHMDERNTPELNSLLEAHHLATDNPSQLSDAFRLGYWASQAEIARLQARAEKWQAIAVELGDQVESAMRGKFHSESGADAIAKLQAMKGETK